VETQWQPRIYGDCDVRISDLRVREGGAVRFRVDGTLADPEDLLRLAAAQGLDPVRLVLVGDGPYAMRIPGTEDAWEASQSRRVAVALRLLEALEESVIAARRNGEIPFEPSADGEPPPFAPGTPVGTTDAETRAAVAELVAADPGRAATAAVEGLRRGRRRRRPAETASSGAEAE
jgi:hypothetical protein